MRGYHPILASRADTGEVLHVRLRKGSANTAARRAALRRRADRARHARRRQRPQAAARRLGLLERQGLRASGAAGWQYSIGVRMRKETSARRSRRSPRHAWQPLADYPADGDRADRRNDARQRRLIVRRTRTLGAQGELFPDWQHFPFTTNRTEAIARRRGRAPPARRRRTRHPRPQRPSPRALPVRPILRQRGLDRDRLPRAQPAALDQRARPPRPHRPRRTNPAPPPARAPRPTDPHAGRWTLRLPARWPWQPRLHRSARPHPSAPRRRLTHGQLAHRSPRRARRTRRARPCPRARQNDRPHRPFTARSASTARPTDTHAHTRTPQPPQPLQNRLHQPRTMDPG